MKNTCKRFKKVTPKRSSRSNPRGRGRLGDAHEIKLLEASGRGEFIPQEIAVRVGVAITFATSGGRVGPAVAGTGGTWTNQAWCR